MDGGKEGGLVMGVDGVGGVVDAQRQGCIIGGKAFQTLLDVSVGEGLVASDRGFLD